MDLETLNPAQRKAVEQTEGPVLILAGAGSGKTRVLTTRIAHLVEDENVNPSNILAITFTNKAANEMRERIEEIIGEQSKDMWVSTFHSCCVRILKKDINKIGYNRSFIIYDSADQVTLIKDCLKELDISEKLLEPKSLISEISSAKDKLLSPKEYKKQFGGDFRYNQIADVYAIYQDRLKRNSALDFDDLIMKTVELLKSSEDVLNYYRGKFKYIMVDEYQDTSRAQYEFIKLLAMGHQNICVVGDDDQSIYGWRGADIRNILEFEKDYEKVTVVKLEQNYRSTQVILDAANYLIANNVERKQKRLWSEQKEGELIKIKLAENEMDEGNFIAEQIYKISENRNIPYSDFAILYRANAQARPIEDALNRSQIPYNIYGGTKFYERKEIRDLVAFLRLIVNPQDDVALKRVINVPRRGIGLRTIEKLEDRASLKQESLYSVLLDVENNSDISSKAKKSLEAFVDIIGVLRSIAEVYSVDKVVEQTLQVTKYMESFEDIIKKNEGLMNGKADEAKERIDHLNEFKSIAMEYENMEINGEEEKSLGNFLMSIALSSQSEEEENLAKVSLMTIHSSKGLEFPVVFLIGMEEKIFPISRAISSMKDSDIEEERRLCYVGITRAKQQLFMTHTSRRTLYGRSNTYIQSRFIEELPEEKLDYLSSVSKPLTYTKSNYNILDKYTKKYKESMNMSETAEKIKAIKKEDKHNQNIEKRELEIGKIKLGSKVLHPKFGVGLIVSKAGSDVTIAFDNKGIKKINLEYTVLEVL